MNNATAGFIFQMLGVSSLGWFIWMMRRQYVVSRWPTTKGEILESLVEQDAEQCDFPLVTYQYSVNKKTYTSNRLYATSGIAATSGSYAASVVARYRVGSRVTVHYNPFDPSDAALEVTFPAWVLALLLAAGVSFIVFGRYVAGM